ncbi:hypothetical protein H5200_22670 [Pseudoalteromonas sp. SG43-7]|jgi:hypothetical protein|uniref:Phage shock protein B n=1 Tax=Pseudoalteromonas neustonica TaxID=1840331 RepID=A0ABY3FES0_9GAMM|nr:MULTISPECIES: hypothetical protein [Pseudoalteromonas]MBB1294770.1 hypothetical protein [Pseudoalteromonas sp. SR41-4]MBB1424681.1 hypothetical protein [Pseudoalteromonas sp. SG43-7]MBB1433545.1 hypothetical protein [Pseudoalteromonas sp. SG43-6]MBB1471192.1 hypothetical protein [Pseudoalteromonas sp. SG41-5]MBB1478181.1 hypothetical protein [Pseudoalteromonas sp. SG41-2]
MFELFLVMLALTSPILIIIFVRNYFNYKSEVNQKILALQKDTDTEAVNNMQKRVEQLAKRVIVLEKIVTDSKFELGQEISQL